MSDFVSFVRCLYMWGYVAIYQSDEECVIYQNPDDLPPGGFLTLMQERTPDLSSSSAMKKKSMMISCI